MSPQTGQHTFRYATANVPRAISQARRAMRLMGWARTSLVKLDRTPVSPGSTHEHVEITLKGAGSRVADSAPDQSSMREEWQIRRGLRKGMVVRTLSVGYNFAAGAHHTMPAGAVGTIVVRDGIVVRVRFSEIPGHSFGYAPSALEVL